MVSAYSVFLVIRPDDTTKRKLHGIVYCYGGGMVMGCPENHLDELFSYANDMGCIVIAPQYRLLPKWTHPAAVDDVSRTLGERMARRITGQVAGKAVPLVGAVISGGISYAGFKPMCQQLHKRLNAYGA